MELTPYMGRVPRYVGDRNMPKPGLIAVPPPPPPAAPTHATPAPTMHHVEAPPPPSIYFPERPEAEEEQPRQRWVQVIRPIAAKNVG